MVWCGVVSCSELQCGVVWCGAHSECLQSTSTQAVKPSAATRCSSDTPLEEGSGDIWVGGHRERGGS